MQGQLLPQYPEDSFATRPIHPSMARFEVNVHTQTHHHIIITTTHLLLATAVWSLMVGLPRH